jgi:hypothetical protein
MFGLVQFGDDLLIIFGLMQFGDDLDSVRTTYLALNSQLVSELPLLIQVNVILYSISFPTFCPSISMPLFASLFVSPSELEYCFHSLGFLISLFLLTSFLHRFFSYTLYHNGCYGTDTPCTCIFGGSVRVPIDRVLCTTLRLL